MMRKQPCEYCNCKIIKIRKFFIKGFPFSPEHIERVYEEKCNGCDALLYGESISIK
jgi:hypothetical protein